MVYKGNLSCCLEKVLIRLSSSCSFLCSRETSSFFHPLFNHWFYHFTIHPVPVFFPSSAKILCKDPWLSVLAASPPPALLLSLPLFLAGALMFSVSSLWSNAALLQKRNTPSLSALAQLVLRCRWEETCSSCLMNSGVTTVPSHWLGSPVLLSQLSKKSHLESRPHLRFSLQQN